MKQTIFLIGFRCVGKSSLALELARLLKTSAMDLDKRILEDFKGPIEDILSKGGWELFRERESLALKEVIKEGHSLIATGGGIVSREENIEFMKKNGLVIWLKARPETILRRMEEDNKRGVSRPLLTDKPLFDEIKELMDLREPLYKRAADKSYYSDELSIEELALKIFKEL